MTRIMTPHPSLAGQHKPRKQLLLINMFDSWIAFWPIPIVHAHAQSPFPPTHEGYFLNSIFL